jgi:hypothetical protein
MTKSTQNTIGAAIGYGVLAVVAWMVYKAGILQKIIGGASGAGATSPSAVAGPGGFEPGGSYVPNYGYVQQPSALQSLLSSIPGVGGLFNSSGMTLQPGTAPSNQALMNAEIANNGGIFGPTQPSSGGQSVGADGFTPWEETLATASQVTQSQMDADPSLQADFETTEAAQYGLND